MQFDTPQPESAPSRRSRRVSVRPDETPGDALLGRAEARRRAASEPSRPAVVWARPMPEATPVVAMTDAAPAPAAEATAVTAPAVESPAVDAAALVEALAVLAAAADVEAPVVPLAPPSSRRAARVATAQNTVVDAAPVVEPAETAEHAETAEPITAEVFELLEPVTDAEPVVELILDEEPAVDDETLTDAEPEASAAMDAFEAAARLFSFTGETPIQQPAAAADASDESAPHVAPRGKKVRAPRPARRGASFRRATATAFSVGAMAIVGLLAVGMTTPAAAVASPKGVDESANSVQELAGDVAVDPDDIQAYVAPAQVENVALDRAGGYDTASLAEIAAADGINHFSSFFTNDPTAAIQWPFPVGVPMTFGYGPRWGAMHQGIDLTPGNGAKIQSIADGVVRSASNATGGYGVNIYIDHVIDGKVITSHYAHLQYGSMRVKTGDHVKVGQVIGVVGNTGHSFGAHLHFEIEVNGTIVDPLPWMRANAGRSSLGN